MSGLVLEIQLGDQTEIRLEEGMNLLDLANLTALDDGFRALRGGVEARRSG